jgi:hypothetical protein
MRYFNVQKILYYVALCLVCASACDDGDTPEKRLAQIGQAYCTCSAPLAALDQEAAVLAADTTKQVEFAAKLEAMQAEYTRLQQCLAPLLADYGRLTADQIKQLEQDFAKHCPNRKPQHEQLVELLGQ